jgi:hypothetical protein
MRSSYEMKPALLPADEVVAATVEDCIGIIRWA